MKLIDQSDPFYRPRWRRVLVVASCATWFAVEVLARDQLWGMIAAALLAYCVWNLFITWPKAPPAS